MKIVTVVCLAALCVMLLGFGAVAQEKQNTPATPKKHAFLQQKAPAANLETKVQAKGEEYFHAVTSDLKNVREHSKMLYYQAANKTKTEMNMTVARQHVDAIGSSLDQAKKNLAQIEMNMSAAEKEEAKDIVAAMHKSLTQADAAYATLKTEIEAPKPSQAAIKKQAAAVNHESENAMVKHDEMKAKYSIQEPPDPVWPQPQE